MTVWFVSRHTGTIEWIKTQGVSIDQWVSHLNIIDIKSGDTVIGTLPVQLAAEVCRCGAKYINLSMDLPESWRGKELSVEALNIANARLEKYQVTHGEKDDL